MAAPTTIPEVTPAGKRHTANGATLNFSYNFAIETPGDIVVFLDDTQQLYQTHYWLTGIGSTAGGEVQFTFYPWDGAKVTILRAQDIQQAVNLLANSSYSPSTIAAMHNRHAAVDQMLAERIARAPKFLPKSSQSDISINEPSANKFLGWNAAAPWEIENKDVVPADSIVLSNNTPESVQAIPDPGVATEVSRSDHIHDDSGRGFNVLDYGADPTGATDSRQAFIDARTAAIASGKILPTIFIPVGAYLISGQLDANNVRWVGEDMFGTIIYQTTSTTAVNGVFRADGVVTAATTLVSGLTIGDRTITVVSAAGFAVGDLVELKITEQAIQAADGTYNSFSLVTRIMDIAGPVLTLLHPVPFAVTGGDINTVSRINPTTCEVSNLTIDGLLNTGHDPFGNNGIVIFYSHNIRLENIYTRNMQKGNGIFLWSCFAGLVKNHYSENVGDVIGFGSALAPNHTTACRFENIMSLWSSRDGMTFNRASYCQFVNLYSQYCQVRNVKFHGCRQCVAVNITGNNSQGGTGLTISGGTSDCAISNITTTGNKGPNASGNQVGVWFADLSSRNNVLSNVNSWDNGDWDITVFATDTGNVVYGGRFSSASKILNQNSTAMFNVTLDDVLSGGLSSLAMVDTRSAGAVGPSHRLHRAFPNPPVVGQLMGEYVFAGNDNANALVEYAKMYSVNDNWAAGALSARIIFSAFTANANSVELGIGNGIVVGVPTGGAKGVGTINAQAVYDDNAILTDYVFDLTQPAPARFDSKFLDLDEYIKFWKEHGHLPSLPSRVDWEKEKSSLGDLIQRLWETCELQAIHIAKLLEKIGG